MDDGLDITVIGCRAGMPHAAEPSSGYLVGDAHQSVLLDCGPGIAGAIRAHLDPRDLDAVVLSHLHLDHCYDVLPLGKAILGPGLGSDTRRRTDRPVLLLPEGGASTLRSLNALLPVGVADHPLDRVVDSAFDTREMTPGTAVELGRWRVSVVLTTHAVACLALRIDTPYGSLAYTGDTAWSADVVALANGVDLLVAEATLRTPDDTGHGHLSASEAGKLAAESRARALLLTHFASTAADHLAALRGDAAANFAGPIHLARPGAAIRVTSTENPRKESSDATP